MSDFERVLNKAIAEISIAKSQGEAHAVAALTQAKYHINLALDDAKRKALKNSSPLLADSPDYCLVNAR